MNQSWHGLTLCVPKRLAPSFAYLNELDHHFNFRKVATYEFLGNRVPLVIVKTTGKGKRETYQGAEFALADFYSIGRCYALAYVYKANGTGRITRIKKDSPRVMVSAEIPEKAIEYLAYLQGEN